MRFECQYCPAVYPDFLGLVSHFEESHRQAEYIIVEIPDGVIQGKEEPRDGDRH